VLAVLSAPLHLHLLKALEAGPLALPDLTQAAGAPPASTMRVYLRQLAELGLLERRQQDVFPGSVDYALTRAGGEFLRAGEVLQRWLYMAPHGPISLGSAAAKSATKALVDGWNVQLVRVLAARPLGMTQLSRIITSINYPTLERRLGAMRLVGLVQPCASRNGRGVPYEVSEWLRSAAAPLAAAVNWEQCHLARTAPAIGRADVESLFLLTVPNLEVSGEAVGACRFAVQSRAHDGRAEFAGVRVAVDEGGSVTCSTRLEDPCDGWAAGSFLDWFRWLGDRSHNVEIGGDARLVEDVVDALRSSLFEGALAS
jgi:DNA-binding HxlR family transcriptional regulator